MAEFYHTLALVLAGLSVVIGIMSYYLGIKRGERTYRFFAFMSFCIAAFLILPPTGFILTDKPPYEMDLLGKRIFIFIYYGIFPWFIVSYTSYRKIHVPAIISAWVALTYCIMYITVSSDSIPVWAFFAMAAFASIFLYGLFAGVNQYYQGDKVKAKWFLASMTIFGFLVLLTIVNQFFPDSGIFFPLHASAIPFMIIMGLRFGKDYQ